ncbi:MAG TPA: sigma-70 family RNA polymerase sigma factor [Bryobacteraceae bacterium]|jgi:RNA polymerase sigma-70 factor (ECF subfamily)|nr:sigma-70 family RNA polymerase sigma factor [Bryobacteraceae bacterium]
MSILLLPILTVIVRSGDDGDLVRRLQERDASAMGDLYDRYGRIAYSVVLRVVRNQAVAEDLVQEAFLRIWTRIHGFDAEKGSLGGWVLTVARNRAVDYLRSLEGRERERTTELARGDEPAVFADFEKDLLNTDRVRLLRGAFEKLNTNQRTVIELAYFEGLSQTEMADKLKQPLGTVKTWVRSALQTLRQELVGAAAV